MLLWTSGIPTESPFSRRELWLLALLSAAGFAVGLRGIINYGYIGQDFFTHKVLIDTFPWSYSYMRTNPPGLYWFGSLMRNHVSSAHYLELVALSFLAFNTLALWIIYGFLWRGISSPQLRFAAAALVTFVPFRVIHAIVLAADALTLPLFALAALFTFRLFGNPRAVASWIGLSLSLCAGMFFKYTFVGLLPPVALLLGVAVLRRLEPHERLRWSAVGILALAAPTAAFALQMRECERQNGNVASGQWLPEGAPSVMRWSDILTLQRSDLELFSAPDYLRGKLYASRKYSYLGLLHVSTFTDVLGNFQPPPDNAFEASNKLIGAPAARDRSPLSQALQEWSVRLSLVFSALAIAGTAYCAVRSGLALFPGRPPFPEAIVVLTALAIGFYSTVFFSLHRLADPYTPGFWMPRLVLPALVVFLGLGFVMLDSACRRLDRHGLARSVVPWTFTGYTIAACAIFVGFLT